MPEYAIFSVLIISLTSATIGLFAFAFVIIRHLVDKHRRNTHRRPQK